MKTLEEIFQKYYGTEDDLRFIIARLLDKEIKACTDEYEAQFGASKDEKMIEFILEIDWMTTREFCAKYGITEPSWRGNVADAANQFLSVDAIKHKMFVEKAKELRRAKTDG